MVICPAKAWEIQDYARESGCRIAVFATDDDVTARDSRRARAVGRVRDGRIVDRGLRRRRGLRSARSGAAGHARRWRRRSRTRRFAAELCPVRRKAEGTPPRVDTPSQPHHDRDKRGPLVLIGGACTPDGEALGSFIDAGARGRRTDRRNHLRVGEPGEERAALARRLPRRRRAEHRLPAREPRRTTSSTASSRRGSTTRAPCSSAAATR